MPYYIKKTGSVFNPSQVMYYVEATNDASSARWSDNYADHKSFVSESAVLSASNPVRACIRAAKSKAIYIPPFILLIESSIVVCPNSTFV